MKLPNFDSRLYGKLIFTNAMGESGGASKIGCSWPWSEHCFWVGLMPWPGLGAASAALGSGFGPWFAVKLQAEEVLEAMTLLGLMEDELLGGANWWVGVSAIGLAQVVVPLRLKEPDFTGKKPPLSWEVVLMGRNTQPFFCINTNMRCKYSKQSCLAAIWSHYANRGQLSPSKAAVQSCNWFIKTCGGGGMNSFGFWGVHDRKEFKTQPSRFINYDIKCDAIAESSQQQYDSTLCSAVPVCLWERGVIRGAGGCCGGWGGECSAQFRCFWDQRLSNRCWQVHIRGLGKVWDLKGYSWPKHNKGKYIKFMSPTANRKHLF